MLLNQLKAILSRLFCSRLKMTELSDIARIIGFSMPLQYEIYALY